MKQLLAGELDIEARGETAEPAPGIGLLGVYLVAFMGISWALMFFIPTVPCSLR